MGKQERHLLTKVEEMILLAVGHLGPNAYGLTIRKHIELAVGRSFSVGAIYVPLERLNERGYLTTREGEPTAVRGGRRKRFYRLTALGVRSLDETRQVHDQLWAQYLQGSSDG